MKESKITIHYNKIDWRDREHPKVYSRSYDEPWEQTTYYCPNCGQNHVWNRSDGGDYYVGELFLCLNCEFEWHWPNEPSKAEDYQSEQRIRELRKLHKGV